MFCRPFYPISTSHCIVCPFSMYDFWLLLVYRLTFLVNDVTLRHINGIHRQLHGFHWNILQFAQNTFWLSWIILILICLRVQYGSILWLEDGNLYLRLRTMSYTIYATKFEQTKIHQHVHLRRESQSHIHLRLESQSYWWRICSNNIVLACFNCTSHIINFGHVDYFQWI